MYATDPAPVLTIVVGVSGLSLLLVLIGLVFAALRGRGRRVIVLGVIALVLFVVTTLAAIALGTLAPQLISG